MPENTSWFSTNVRIVCLIEGEGAARYMDCVHLMRATDFEHAMTRALALGRTHESEYKNAERQLVRWRLQEVVSLDAIPKEDLDGAEVYSEPKPLEEGSSIPFDTDFRPEDSEPTQTI